MQLHYHFRTTIVTLTAVWRDGRQKKTKHGDNVTSVACSITSSLFHIDTVSMMNSEPVQISTGFSNVTSFRSSHTGRLNDLFKMKGPKSSYANVLP